MNESEIVADPINDKVDVLLYSEERNIVPIFNEELFELTPLSIEKAIVKEYSWNRLAFASNNNEEKLPILDVNKRHEPIYSSESLTISKIEFTLPSLDIIKSTPV
ncbi:MAG: hypothetical protein JXR64_00280, partial [Spirochaetales bacterium]|nr:hypothetical protein [Spirochaetales bacterium]